MSMVYGIPYGTHHSDMSDPVLTLTVAYSEWVCQEAVVHDVWSLPIGLNNSQTRIAFKYSVL